MTQSKLQATAESNDLSSPASKKFAIWQCHGRQCWLCDEPLIYAEMTLEHVIPKSIKPRELKSTLKQFGLGSDFNIDGYENLLPAHRSCNAKKADLIFKPVPLVLVHLERMSYPLKFGH